MNRGKRVKKKTPTLHSYVLSLLSLVLCCAMFMSATMAWFTSEKTTSGIRVYAGTLSVDLQDKNGNSLHGTTGALFNEVYLNTTTQDDEEEPSVTYWQDGAVSFAEMQVVNQGDLALDYWLYMTITLDTLGENEKVDDITDCFEVYVKENWFVDGKIGFVDVAAEGSGWTKITVGKDNEAKDTLTAILAPVMTTDREGNDVSTGHGTAIDDGKLPGSSGDESAGNPTKEFTVALRMKENNEPQTIEVDDQGNPTTSSIMGESITLNVKLVASQQIANTAEQNINTAAEGE